MLAKQRVIGKYGQRTDKHNGCNRNSNSRSLYVKVKLRLPESRDSVHFNFFLNKFSLKLVFIWHLNGTNCDNSRPGNEGRSKLISQTNSCYVNFPCSLLDEIEKKNIQPQKASLVLQTSRTPINASELRIVNIEERGREGYLAWNVGGSIDPKRYGSEGKTT